MYTKTSKTLFFCLILSSILLGGTLSINQESYADGNFLKISNIDSTQFEYNNQIVKLNGVNVNNLGGLGIWQAANINKIEVGPGDYEKISQLGANHVRFGMSYQWYLNNPTNFYSIIDSHVQWAHDNNLWLIPTMFTLPYLNENTNDGSAHPNGGCYQGYSNPCNFWGTSIESVNAREAFKSFWIEFVDRYKDEEAIAGYDLINEPWTNDETYNRGTTLINYYTDIITSIVNGNHNSTQLFFLESEPEPLSWVLFDSYASGVSKLNNLKTITNNRIVLSSHMYEPYSLTHYDRQVYPTTEDGVIWSNTTMTNPTAPDTHPGSIIQELRSGQTITVNGVNYTDFTNYITAYPNDIRNRFGILFANDDLDLPVYIGEWSAQQTTAADGTGWHTTTFLDYNSDVANLLDDWGVHNAVFEFKAGTNNWGLYKETGAKSYGSFNEVVSFNADNNLETTQPFIDTLSEIWDNEIKPNFVTVVPSVCQNGIIEGAEQCDDANNLNSDGCSQLCKIERKGPTLSGIRNICSIQASLSDFRFDGYHRIGSGSYTNPASIPADNGYPTNSSGVRLGNDGSNYNIPYLWFESVNVQKNASLSNAYIDFNIASNTASTNMDATVYGLKVGGNLRTYDPDGGSATRYYVDRNPYSSYLGGANWVNWRSFASSSATSPFVGFPHDTLTRSNGAVYQWNRTVTNTVWSMPTESLQIDQYYPSANIASVVNELTTEAGWNPGNDLGFILIPGLGSNTAVRYFYGFDASISTSLNNYSYTPTNSDTQRTPRFYANCNNYVSGLTAKPDNFEVRQNNSLTGDVKIDNNNDVDLNPGNYGLSYSIISNVSNGNLTFNTANGTFTYQPNNGFSGNDFFRYVISDSNGGTSNATASIQVIGNVYPYLNPVVTFDGDLTLNYEIEANASDSDGSISFIEWSVVSAPGAVSFGNSHSDLTIVSFSASGTYTLQVQATDNEGGVSTENLVIEVPSIEQEGEIEYNQGNNSNNQSSSSNVSNSNNLNNSVSNDGTSNNVVSYVISSSYPVSYTTGSNKPPTSNSVENENNGDETQQSSNNVIPLAIGIVFAGATGLAIFLNKRGNLA